MNWQSSTQWLQGINCKRWAARQSPSWTSTANQIRLLLELVTAQPSHAATRTRLKGKVNFKNIFLLPAKSLNSGSTKASRGPLMLSRFRDRFQIGNVPLWLKTYFQTNVLSDRNVFALQRDTKVVPVNHFYRVVKNWSHLYSQAGCRDGEKGGCSLLSGRTIC